MNNTSGKRKKERRTLERRQIQDPVNNERRKRQNRRIRQDRREK
jgi:hypothetical protein